MRSSARLVTRLFLAWLAIAAVAAGATGTAFVGHAGDDRECAPVAPGPHDHSAHRLVPEAEPEPGHCLACHLTRSVRVASTATVLSPSLAFTAGKPLPPADSPPSADRSGLSPRAPPASLA